MRAHIPGTNGAYCCFVVGLKLLAGFRFCAGLWLFVIACHVASAQVIRPIPIPGRIEAENYDTNGPGISFYDNTPGNSGGDYRNEDVDIEVTTDIGGGYD